MSSPSPLTPEEQAFRQFQEQLINIEARLSAFSDDCIVAFKKSPLYQQDINNLKEQIDDIQNDLRSIQLPDNVRERLQQELSELRGKANAQNGLLDALHGKFGLANSLAQGAQAISWMLEDAAVKLHELSEDAVLTIKHCIEDISLNMKKLIGRLFTDPDSIMKKLVNNARDTTADLKDIAEVCGNGAKGLLKVISYNLHKFALTIKADANTKVANHLMGTEGAQAGIAAARGGLLHDIDVKLQSLGQEKDDYLERMKRQIQAISRHRVERHEKNKDRDKEMQLGGQEVREQRKQGELRAYHRGERDSKDSAQTQREKDTAQDRRPFKK